MPAATRRGFFKRAIWGGAAAAQLRLASAAHGACPGLRGPVRWIVPNAAGGGYDAFSRLLAPYLERGLGARIHVDNIAGAGGLRGATVLSGAAPDGATLGILNLPGLLMTAMTEGSALDPLRSFTMLGTVARSRHVWATSSGSGLDSFDRMLEESRKRPLVFAMNSFSSLGFLTAALPCSLLEVPADLVAGYSGSTDSAMAAIRGEVDLVSLSWDTQLDRILAGDLRPLFRVCGDTPPEHPLLAGLPTLAGPRGLAAQRGADVLAKAEALVRFSSAGRIIAGPPKMAPEMQRCVEEVVCKALTSPDLAAAAAARSPVEPACAAETLANAGTVQADGRALAPLFREAVARLKG